MLKQFIMFGTLCAYQIRTLFEGDGTGGGGSASPTATVKVDVSDALRQLDDAKKKSEPSVDVVKERGDAIKAERERVNTIMEFAKRNPQVLETAEKFVSEGRSIEEFQKEILAKHFNAKPVDTKPEIGMSPNEVRRYSFLRAIHAAASNDWRNAGFELEVSQAAASRMHKEGQGTRGFIIPYDVLTADIYGHRRDIQVGNPASPGTGGGNLVAIELLSGSFIELLRNRMMVRALGATVLGGLVGDIAIPKQTGGATAYWVGESTDITAESSQTFTQLGLRPKSLGSYTDYSRKMILQSSLDVEAFVRGDLAKALALEIDRAAIDGSGSGAEPTGVLNTSGIGAVTSGGTPDWDNVVDLETAVAAENADIGSLAYLTNAKVRGLMKKTPLESGYPVYIWTKGSEPGFGEMNGYRAGCSNQVPSDYIISGGSSGSGASCMIFGNWADLIIAEWGALDILVDPYTGGLQGTVRVRLFMDSDIGVRHAESFAAIKDINV